MPLASPPLVAPPVNVSAQLARQRQRKSGGAGCKSLPKMKVGALGFMRMRDEETLTHFERFF